MIHNPKNIKQANLLELEKHAPTDHAPNQVGYHQRSNPLAHSPDPPTWLLILRQEEARKHEKERYGIIRNAIRNRISPNPPCDTCAIHRCTRMLKYNKEQRNRT
jgi:hypothetical protein